MKLPSQNNLSIEPKSVLDIRRSLPSPVAGNSSDLNFQHEMINQVDEFDSDSLMRELGLLDDAHHHSNKSVYPLDLPDLPSFFHSDFETLDSNSNVNFFDLINQHEHENEIDYRNELIRLTDCFETQSFHLAEVILTELNQRLRSPVGKAFHRSAFYFKQAIQSLFNGTIRSFVQSCTSFEIVQVIKAYKTFSTVSPIPMFSSFTANQTILDAVNGAMIVHVIDFDIGFGGQWASFLKAVVEKAEARKVNTPAVRITAVVPEEYDLESRLIRDNLYQFCDDLKLCFEIEFVSIRAFEIACFKAVKFVSGEKTAVVLSPMIFRRIGSGFVNDLRRVSPNVVVCIDNELNGFGGSSFRKTVIDGLELFTAILESLEAAKGVGGGGDGGDWMRSVEMFVLLPKIMVLVEDAAVSPPSRPWTEVVGRVGMRPVEMSQFVEFQAECLVRRVQVRGFHVTKQQAEMMLCWHDRPIVAMSAWSF